MDAAELTAVLEDAGLSPYQAEAYVTLLELGTASATRVADESAVPDPRIYDVLRDLEAKDYIETYQQGTLQARARDPEAVITDLRSRADRFTTAAEAIEDRWNNPALDDHTVSVVKRFETVLEEAQTLIESATHQVQLSVSTEEFGRLESALSAALARDVNVRLSLYSPGEDGSELPDESTLARTCTEARHRTLPSPFVALVDRTWTCYAPKDLSSSPYGVVVDDRTHTYIFNWYFLTGLWEVWDTLYSGRRDEPPLRYVDVRRCVREIAPLIEDGAVVQARVVGYDTATGEEVDVAGSIVDLEYAGAWTGDPENLPLSHLAGRINLTIEGPDGRFTVGGWGATVEEIEAVRVTVERVAWP